MSSFARRAEVAGEYNSFSTIPVSSATFVTFGEIECKIFRTKVIHLQTILASIGYKVLGSIDGGTNYDITVVSSANITLGGSTSFQITTMYTNLRIQCANPSTSSTGGILAGMYFDVTL